MKETETAGRDKLMAWNKFIHAMISAENLWKAYNKESFNVDTLQVPAKTRRAMTTYAKASSFNWFLESFMRYVATVGGFKNLIIKLNEKKEDDNARS